MTTINVKNKTRVTDLELDVDTNAYTANDVVGGLLTFNVHTSGGGGTLRRVVLIDEDSVAAAFTLYLFDVAPTTIADDAAYAPTIADLRKLIGTVAIAAGDYVTVNSLDYVEKADVNIEFTAANGNIYGYLVATGTPTYTNADSLYLRLFWWGD